MKTFFNRESRIEPSVTSETLFNSEKPQKAGWWSRKALNVQRKDSDSVSNHSSVDTWARSAKRFVAAKRVLIAGGVAAGGAVVGFAGYGIKMAAPHIAAGFHAAAGSHLLIPILIAVGATVAAIAIATAVGFGIYKLYCHVQQKKEAKEAMNDVIDMPVASSNLSAGVTAFQGQEPVNIKIDSPIATALARMPDLELMKAKHWAQENCVELEQRIDIHQQRCKWFAEAEKEPQTDMEAHERSSEYAQTKADLQDDEQELFDKKAYLQEVEREISFRKMSTGGDEI